MTSRGKQIAALVAILVVLLLPKRVPCGYPGGECTRPGPLSLQCTKSELEPLLFYGIELVMKRDIGFAYSTRDDCR